MLEVTSFGSVMILLGVSWFLAWSIETVVEAVFGKWIDYFVKDVMLKSLIMQIIPLALGVYSVGFLYQFDFFAWISVSLAAGSENAVVLPVTMFGRVWSGLSVGMGASYMHDVISKFLKKPDEILKP